MVDFRRTLSGDPDGFEEGVLRIHGRGDEPVENVAGLLSALNETYEGLVRYQLLLDRLYGYARWQRRYEPHFDPERVLFWSFSDWSTAPLPPGFRLSLKGVRLQSPGFWEFLGKLNPLEVLRNAVNDAHERRKDREYRESAEKDRLRLENMIRENEIFHGRVAILRDLGVTEQEMAQIRTQLIHRPMERLLEYQGTSLIAESELNPPPSPTVPKARRRRPPNL